MNEVEYVVPPDSGAPKVSNNKVEPPKKPSKFLAWVSANKAASAAGLVMAIIIVFAGTAMITGQKVSIFGLQLNPLYQQANCSAEDLGSNCGGGDTTGDGDGTIDNQGGVPDISISGTFSEGEVGKAYSQDFTVVGAPSAPCTWSLVSIAPSISGAALTRVDNVTAGPSAASFTATPQTAGTYQVSIKVVCPGGYQTTENYSWVVKGTSTNRVSISGDFPSSVAGQAYSTTVRTQGGGTNLGCVLTLTSVTPAISDAKLVGIQSLIANPEILSAFSATPQSAGTYKVTIQAKCQNSQEATKTFDWIVTGQGNNTSRLGIVGTFADGKVNEAYSTTLQTSSTTYSVCDWTLVSVTPAIAGASLKRLEDVAKGGASSAAFTATPKTAGNYIVKASVSCGEPDGQRNSVQKDFTWKVTGSSGGGGSGGGGSSASNCSSNKDKLMPIYRFWKAADGDHFYTTNANEKPVGYVSEGISGYVYKEKVSGTTAIYRSYHSGVKAHYYSTTDDATNYGYANEGILGYAYSGNATGALPWFRLHKGFPQSDYLETISTKEKSEAMAIGYMDEGIVANICEKNI